MDQYGDCRQARREVPLDPGKTFCFGPLIEHVYANHILLYFTELLSWSITYIRTLCYNHLGCSGILTLTILKQLFLFVSLFFRGGGHCPDFPSLRGTTCIWNTKTYLPHGKYVNINLMVELDRFWQLNIIWSLPEKKKKTHDWNLLKNIY